jgi:PHP family Zn ribbon phosphoesterase
MHRDGLKWRKIDLHVHTPASDDYKGSETPDEFVQKAIQKGLDGIAVTDHNTADWVNKVIEAAKGTDLVVFPGVELTVTGGKSSIHIVGIFDPRKNSKHIEQVLTKAGFTPEQYGDLEAVTKKSVIDTLEIIDGAGGLAVGAHIDSSKGITSDMRGQARIEVMNSQYLSAVEVTKWADTTKYLDGSDDNYKKIAAYRASDNPHARGGHTVESVGDRYTWFKMDSLDLEGLRQCFNDSDVRIRADVESTEIPDSDCPYISDIKIEGGFLDGQHFIFHKGLNCIIGGNELTPF